MEPMKRGLAHLHTFRWEKIKMKKLYFYFLSAHKAADSIKLVQMGWFSIQMQEFATFFPNARRPGNEL
jgi:hypothetical protein